MKLMQKPTTQIPSGDYYCPKDKETILQYKEWTTERAHFRRFFCAKCGQLYEVEDIVRLQKVQKRQLEAEYLKEVEMK